MAVRRRASRVVESRRGSRIRALAGRRLQGIAYDAVAANLGDAARRAPHPRRRHIVSPILATNDPSNPAYLIRPMAVCKMRAYYYHYSTSGQGLGVRSVTGQ
jgi:hypothetical protein